PDPGVTAGTKLYSQEFYGLARRVLAPGGRLVVHAGAFTARHRVFRTVESTLRAAGLHTAAYRVTGSSAGDWGFLLAARTSPSLRLDPHDPRPATLTPRALARAARAAAGARGAPEPDL
ncbi:spermidine synthase, partial [Streptomyces sp. TRM76130]|nr:spermidine synthase [Streptomyces sp. TRM76130]